MRTHATAQRTPRRRNIIPLRSLRRGVISLTIQIIVGIGIASQAWVQLRVFDYNTGEAARAGIDTILAAVGAESLNGVSKAPDILTLEEQVFLQQPPRR